MKNRGRGKLGWGSVPRLAAPNISQRPGGSTPSRIPTPLPSQYNFTPSQPLVTEMPQPQFPISSPGPHFRDFPPPQQLFHDSLSQQREIGNSSTSIQNQNSHSPPLQPSPASAHHHSQALCNQSSAAHNIHGEDNVEDDGEDDDGLPPGEPVLQEDLQRAISGTEAKHNLDPWS